MRKAELRRTLLKVRQSMSIKAWQQKSDRICFHLESSPFFSQAKTILAYFSFRQEPDLSSLFTNPKYCWGFPRCVEKSLFWHTWQPGEALEKGRFGIFEPSPNSPLLQPDIVDLILVPAIACDSKGYRLGYGGGYYDRLLSSPEWINKPTIGIVFELAYLPQLPTDTWDRQLHSVCTETSLQIIRSNTQT